jgi:hypothetical protein
MPQSIKEGINLINVGGTYNDCMKLNVFGKLLFEMKVLLRQHSAGNFEERRPRCVSTK